MQTNVYETILLKSGFTIELVGFLSSLDLDFVAKGGTESEKLHVNNLTILTTNLNRILYAVET